MGDVPPQPFALVEQVDLRPEVQQAVGPWCAGQLHYLVHPRAHGLERFEPQRCVVLKAAGFVQHHHVKIPAAAQCVHQPGDVLAVDDVNIRLGCQSGFALLLGAQHGGNAQVPQVPPLGGFVLPRCFGDLLRGNDEHLVDLQPVVDQLVDGSQGDDSLAQAHLHPECHARLFQNGVDARLLIRVRMKLLHCFDLRFF